MLLWTSNYQRERAFEWQTSAESGPFPFVAASLWQAPLGHLHLHLLHADLGICPPGGSEFRREDTRRARKAGFWELAANRLWWDGMGAVTGCASERKGWKQPAFIHSLYQESPHGTGTWATGVAGRKRPCFCNTLSRLPWGRLTGRY